MLSPIVSSALMGLCVANAPMVIFGMVRSVQLVLVPVPHFAFKEFVVSEVIVQVALRHAVHAHLVITARAHTINLQHAILELVLIIVIVIILLEPVLGVLLSFI